MSDELWNNPELQQLSQQSTHYSQEEERQSQKLKRKAARESLSISSSTKKKKQRPPKSSTQLKHHKEYTRIKYKKTTNYTNEVDTNGSIEYLVRKKLTTKNEQIRLKRIVKERSDKKLHLFDDDEPPSALDDDNAGKVAAKSNDSVVNWNYINEGYTTMPNSDAQKLSFYVYNNNSSRKRKNMQKKAASNVIANTQQKKMASIPEEEEVYSSSSSTSSSTSTTSRGRGSGGPRYKTSLVIAAKSGCTKCTMELESGIHVKSLHDLNCPRKKKSRRRLRQGMVGGVGVDGMLDGSSNQMLDEMNASTKFDTSNSKPRKKRRYIKQSQKPSIPKYEPDNNTLPRSFPLHFNTQTTNRNDLYQGINKQTSGIDKLIFNHGRNVKRLWVRLVASGSCSLMDGNELSDSDDEGSNTNNNSVAKKQDTKEEEEEKKESDSISKMSSNSSTSSLQFSSSSSNDSYVEPISQLTNTTSIIDTTLINIDNNDDDDEDNKSKRGSKGRKCNPTLRLMEMVHSLPKDTFRNSYILKIGREVGANRLLWENQLLPLLKSAAVDVDGSSEMGTVLASQCKALKSYLGVDNNTIHSPPLWMCDPSLSTNPIVLRNYMNGVRKSLLKNAKEWSKQNRIETNLTLVEGTTTEEASAEKKNEEVEGITADDDGEEAHAEATTTKMEDIHNDEMFDPSQEVVKGEEGDPDEVMIPNTIFKPLKSLLDTASQATPPNPGGIDKYAKFIHESKIDVSNVNVALAWFMAQLTSSKAKLQQAKQQHQTDSSPPSFKEDRTTLIKTAQEEVNEWNESIQSYLQLVESLTSVRDAQFYKCGDLYPQCAPLATAVMTSQSYIANGGGSGGSSIGLGGEKRHDPFKVKTEEEEYDEEDEEPELTLDEQALHQIHLSATDLSRRGRDQNKHLTSFTPIHLTTGIVMITEILPHNSPAVDLISRQCCPDSSDNNRTSFDLVSNVITLIEKDGTLISAPDMMGYIDTRNKIIDEVLVKAMRDASMVFRKCIECDPEDVNHWSWYVAAMLGMLCIAYGSFTSVDGSNVKEEEEYDHQTRIPRHQLESFDEIRCNASVALNDFLKFTQDYGCPMFYLASTSMLEWDKAILLLHRPQSLSEFGLDVRRLHAHHTYQWATKVTTTSSIAKVRQLCEANLLPRDALLDLLACAVEKNPCSRENWVHLANALGRVDATENNKDECLHSEEPTDQEHQDWWWGKDRVSTWKEEFFNTPKSATQTVKSEFVRIVSQVVESVLQTLLLKIISIRRRL